MCGCEEFYGCKNLDKIRPILEVVAGALTEKHWVELHITVPGSFGLGLLDLNRSEPPNELG